MDDDILSDIVNPDDLKRCEEFFNQESRSGTVSRDTKFAYACCLVRSKYQADIRKGINLFQTIFKEDNTEEGKRDSLYFLALGHARLKNFCESLNLIESFLKVEPNNKQLKDLETVVRKRMKQDGVDGLVAAGSAALVIGGLVGLGLAFASRRKKNSDDK